ncbi:Ribosomal protein L11 methyltransferase [Frankliniella fusca]|uniref:Ribosomal protein L11 methyltransferase n=1 Tax=Frankliniella fusca TaxID=407009 RepID=A0AAE1HE36_9NEOP|nr:Ribosomal protein L11 methyltransferase [Frankliniella fusca]
MLLLEVVPVDLHALVAQVDCFYLEKRGRYSSPERVLPVLWKSLNWSLDQGSTLLVRPGAAAGPGSSLTVATLLESLESLGKSGKIKVSGKSGKTEILSGKSRKAANRIVFRIKLRLLAYKQKEKDAIDGDLDKLRGTLNNL